MRELSRSDDRAKTFSAGPSLDDIETGGLFSSATVAEMHGLVLVNFIDVS